MPKHPGVLLAAQLDEMDMTKAELARRVGVTRKHVKHICQGRADISVFLAVLLAGVTGIDTVHWVYAQAAYDSATAGSK